MTRILPVFLALAACKADATWAPETWGEGFIEDGIPADEFADGCSATFDQFLIRVDQAALVDGDDVVVADMEQALVFDMALPGPHAFPEIIAPKGFYDTARFAIRPGTAAEGNADPAALDGHAVRVAGTLTCDADTVSFDLSFDSNTTYDCDPEDLTLTTSAPTATQLTIHGDHMFYDSLESPDAVLRGLVWIQADADADGVLTEAELRATPIAPLGYDVGSQGDVADLFTYLESITSSFGHIDGEGHCATTRN
jgi:hypothetical protein